jgi:hypothetical protein
MDVLRAYHQRLINDSGLRQSVLVGAGIFVRTPDGGLAVAKPYEKIFASKHEN